MVESGTVITTYNAFVVADKIDKMQWIKGFNENTLLLEVLDSEEAGIYIATKHFNIIASPQQKFITSISELTYISAKKITRNKPILTADGYQLIEEVVHTDKIYEMTNLITESGLYVGNSFYLLSDKYGSE